ncbi:MAG: hypothetical protein A2700_02180 [Candidatus Blackburnbacteria bacterium RIFCSPHIGHO2_01_FULL_44_64]|uniref:BioF2-like acetyltransferase domain-containing protein n=1 Tax=Candidatus Blackburnbacteria bacterium RIFCSPHIGHO2_02_FULL_44_20 TaxID=1797516 RepID=A0A1G1VA91_9BACT|nr:MAG: hypothetical protein A2700_02180 [Candidatus Blackburnbacteria bacterium RIFCSPHIGHO2_01_FULL_44_64]OGY12283.1 MAG: hypothetical protein A3D26_01815 [Candidatus Blackburnbacteria bacterium RIFCSPHIGHO2_02_FULL_44_20]
MWEEFSSNETLFDLWELRYAIILAYNFPLHFYTVLQSGKPVAFLPLWYNTEEELYEFVGGFYPEENYFFCHNKDLIPKVLEIIPKPAQLLGISTKRMPKDFDKSPFIPDEPKFISFLNSERTIDQFLQRVSKKARHNLKSTYKKINEKNPEVEYINDPENYKKYMEDLRRFSVKRFKNTHEPSAFEDVRECEVFTNLCQLQGRYETGMIVIKINDQTVAVDLVAFHKERAYLLTGASDLENFPGIGSYIFYVELEESLKRGVKVVDCLQYDYGWKHRYFDAQPMLKFKK